MSLTVGVIVPCKNEAQTIELCLRALRTQEPAPQRIVVVDNGSTDGSVDIARTLADEVLEQSSGSISHLRNAGAAAVGQVDVLAFVDADCEVGPGWLAAGLTALGTADLVGSRTLASSDAGWVAARWAAIEAATAHGGSHVWSQHLLTPRVVFEALKGFDTTLPTGEDADLSARAAEAGYRVALVPEMVATHHGFPSTLRRFLRRERWHTRAPGWFSRMSTKSQGLVVAAALWEVLGVVSAVTAATGRRRAVVAWSASSVVAVPLLGATAARSWRYAWRDGLLLGIWASVRAMRLPREILHSRGGAPRR